MRTRVHLEVFHGSFCNLSANTVTSHTQKKTKQKTKQEATQKPKLCFCLLACLACKANITQPQAFVVVGFGFGSSLDWDWVWVLGLVGCCIFVCFLFVWFVPCCVGNRLACMATWQVAAWLHGQKSSCWGDTGTRRRLRVDAPGKTEVVQASLPAVCPQATQSLDLYRNTGTCTKCTAFEASLFLSFGGHVLVVHSFLLCFLCGGVALCSV